MCILNMYFRHWIIKLNLYNCGAESSVNLFRKKLLLQIQVFWLGDSEISFDIWIIFLRNQLTDDSVLIFWKKSNQKVNLYRLLFKNYSLSWWWDWVSLIKSKDGFYYYKSTCHLNPNPPPFQPSIFEASTSFVHIWYSIYFWSCGCVWMIMIL